MTFAEQKNLVRSIYPNCQCHLYHIDESGVWYIIFPEGVDPACTHNKPIEYSFVSEEAAWGRAARTIMFNMVRKLES
jgi:hypothetical protein